MLPWGPRDRRHRYPAKTRGRCWTGRGLNLRTVGRAMLQKCAGGKFDLVMPCGESALQQRGELFLGVPMVFCTVEDAALADFRLPPDVTAGHCSGTGPPRSIASSRSIRTRSEWHLSSLPTD